MAKKKATEKKKYEVRILERVFLSLYPKIKEEHRRVMVRYRRPTKPSHTIYIDLFNLFGDKQHEAELQIKKREGTMATKYFRTERKFIREAIEHRVEFKPEIMKV